MKGHESLPDRMKRYPNSGLWAVLLVLAAVVTAPGLIASAHAGENPEKNGQSSEIEDKLGVRIEGLRLSAAGYMLDFRYRLLDPAKAAPLLDRKLSPYLLDESTGVQLSVPTAPKVGQLRPTSRNKVIQGRNYYILFANPGRFMKSGSKVAMMLGDLKIEHLTVQ